MPHNKPNGPFKIIQDGERLLSSGCRNYECKNYENCLGIAASLEWEDFGCGDCPGYINQNLLWQAYHNRSKDIISQKICETLPSIYCFTTDENGETLKRARKSSFESLFDEENPEFQKDFPIPLASVRRKIAV